ncbi:MAG TPA: SMC family ATPase [Gemmatimonadales bacterium]|nr:SMC family ATPase [Gemmatimonadales bacterium]
MELHRLRLVNFRQHERTELEFGPGITGIIGPNGSGKTTILEGIAWALYGAQAVRGDRDSIRRLTAPGRANVEVELEFRLGAHEYRVVRTLSSATLHQDGGLVANSLKVVTDKLERSLGMTHAEFFNTYFTSQKELKVMAGLRRSERAAFLSQVLGYERLRLAQDAVREERNTLAAELRALEAALPDSEALAAARRDAEARLAAAHRAVEGAEAARKAAQDAVRREEPRWQEWVARRERTLSLDGERRMALQAVELRRQDFQRLDRELAEALQAREQWKRVTAELSPLGRLRQELVALEQLQRDASARRAELAQLDELALTVTHLERRLSELADTGTALEAAERDAGALAEALEAAELTAEEERGTWVREREYAKNRRTELLRQYDEVKEQRDKIAQLGPEGECPTCRRPLGVEHDAVLGILDRQLQAIVDDGKYFRQRVEQLADTPAAVVAADRRRDALREDSRRVIARAGEVRAQAEEGTRATNELGTARTRAAALERQVATRPSGYDADRHDAVRADLVKLEPVALEAAALEERAQRAEGLVTEAELAERTLSQAEQRVRTLSDALAAEGFSEERYRLAKDRYDRALGTLREAELALVEVRGEWTRAESDVADAGRRAEARAAQERYATARRMRLRLHNDLDRAFSDLRAELNAAMRPEIGELGSSFLADLTDGRYDELELNEDYDITVVADGVPKPVISGGEEDLANLVLRLAISQMIAERAGQPLSLLVLDEIFGSLDEVRRQHVVGLLRRLADRFPQVILITHIEQVRDGVDRVFRVTYDSARGTSVVQDDPVVPGAADAGVAA